jgi:hypothetical protein
MNDNIFLLDLPIEVKSLTAESSDGKCIIFLNSKLYPHLEKFIRRAYEGKRIS